MFSGKYATEVPKAYFEHLSQLRGRKKARDVKKAVLDATHMMNGVQKAMLELALNQEKLSTFQSGDFMQAGAKSPEIREDIR